MGMFGTTYTSFPQMLDELSSRASEGVLTFEGVDTTNTAITLTNISALVADPRLAVSSEDGVSVTLSPQRWTSVEVIGNNEYYNSLSSSFQQSVELGTIVAGEDVGITLMVTGEVSMINITSQGSILYLSSSYAPERPPIAQYIGQTPDIEGIIPSTVIRSSWVIPPGTTYAPTFNVNLITSGPSVLFELGIDVERV